MMTVSGSDNANATKKYAYLMLLILLFSFTHESYSTIANVCLSVTETPQPLRIAPIDHRAYQPSSLSTSGLLSRLFSLSAC